MIVELFFLIIFLIISIAYSLVYAVILNYIFKITFKKINKTKPFILNYFFLFCGILFIIIFLKFTMDTSYSDFHNRYIKIAKNYRIENNDLGGDSDILQYKELEDTSIEYTLRFYNGGTCLSEQIKEIINRVDKGEMV